MMEIGFQVADVQIALAGRIAGAGAETCPVLDVPIGVLTMAEAVSRVNGWIARGTRAHLVTFVNAHMVVEAHLRPEFRASLQGMDLNCADGAPVFWLARRENGARVQKIAGPEFMPLFCAQSVQHGHRHFLYGGTEGVADGACAALERECPGIQIAGHYCPPFRPLSDAEKSDVVARINSSGADLVWVCLGCPKQEEWMAEMRDRLRVKAVLAVGQAFDILAGRTQRAPALLSRFGGEWAYRLVKEPRRLWKRYLVTNLLFLLFVLRDRMDRGSRPGALGAAESL